ncbi:hypothetical protein RJ641_016944, partial [Dillenia turbinata]
MEGEKGLVCVTVGTGSIASWLIMRLLQDGYKVQNTTGPEPSKKHLYKYLSNNHMVHAYDVARAHIFLFTIPTAKGSELEGIEGKKFPHFSSKKLLDAGFKFKYGLNEMFDGAVGGCKEKGFLQFT